MTRQRKRFLLVGISGLVLVAAAVLVLTALQGTVTFFYSPSDLQALTETPTRPIRVGGLVVPGSVDHGEEGGVAFALTDQAAEIVVRYAGILPDLFREGQGIVVEGHMTPEGHVEARQVLAKHDETYMPPEVADALKKQGHWREGEGTAAPASEQY